MVRVFLLTFPRFVSRVDLLKGIHAAFDNAKHIGEQLAVIQVLTQWTDLDRGADFVDLASATPSTGTPDPSLNPNSSARAYQVKPSNPYLFVQKPPLPFKKPLRTAALQLKGHNPILFIDPIRTLTSHL